MKGKFLALAMMCLSTTLTSCFKDEPLNAECDIEQAYIHVDNPEAMFFSKNDTLQKVLYTENEISFNVRRGTDLSALAPRCVITEGATIQPENGSTHDFTNGPVAYTVTSEDGQWTRTYNVKFNIVTRTFTDSLRYDFKDYALNKASQQYYEWTETTEDGTKTLNFWSTGNGGFAICRGSYAPDQYPTIPLPGEGVDGGIAMKLTTSDTGPLGAIKNMRIAAGNLFIGKFDPQTALDPSKTMEATMFGRPTDVKPLTLCGYYKYKPGAKFQNVKGKEVKGRIDKGSIYAVMYRNHDADGKDIVLHGDNVLTSDMIVGKAVLENVETTDEWIKFDVPFVFSEEINEDLLANRGYSLAVVFSSSEDGAKFEGAVGSTLLISKVRVACAKTE